MFAPPEPDRNYSEFSYRATGVGRRISDGIVCDDGICQDSI